MRRITVAAVSLLLTLGLTAAVGGPGTVQAGNCRVVNGQLSCI
jgi:hypothetical protein